MALAPQTKIRNFAIIAHVDHGKTTLVDAILKQTSVYRSNETVIERVMDSNDLERERGITIFSKNASYNYEGVKFNIVDTPGHADFGGEVERVLKMVDGVLLLVDAAEGPLPQTRFVLKKSMELGLQPIVVINKIDRPDQRAHVVHDMVLDLFISLGATEEQCDFPCIYATARAGTCRLSMDQPDTDLKPLLNMIAEKFPAPMVDLEAPFQMLVSNIQYSDYVGRIAIGRIRRGRVSKETPLTLMKEGDKQIKGRATKIVAFQGLKQIELDGADAGDIVGLAGFEDVYIGDTLCHAETPEALERITVDEPTLSMTFGVNTSPLAGTEGKFVTARHLKNRLEKELLSNLALRVEAGTGGGENFVVSGRGELHLGILIETMRREGFELEVGKPRVIFKKDENGKTLEPYEKLIIDLPTDSMGGVIERLGQRKAEMNNMTPNDDQTRLEFTIPSRCLLGFRTEFLTITRGNGALHHIFDKYDDYKGEGASRSRGVLWATDAGESNAYGIYGAQERGTMFIKPQEKVYVGMIVGEHSRENDLGVNITKMKALTNMRASGTDEALTLTPPRDLSLEQCLEYIEDDELVEVTPLHIRLRKKILDPNARKRAEKSSAGAAA